MLCGSCGSSRCSRACWDVGPDRRGGRLRGRTRSGTAVAAAANVERGLLLLAAAVIALLVLLVNELTGGAAALTHMATAVLGMNGVLGTVLLALGVVRD